MSKNILQEKSYKFALRIIKLCEYLNSDNQNYSLTRKLFDSGTAIGAFVEEAKQGENRSDFLQKLALANKEAFKTNYWLRLLHDSETLSDKQFESVITDCEELQKILISSLKTTKKSEE
jgi:four helix bundle protein